MAHRHFKIHKPAGFVSQFINNKRRKKHVLGELYDFPEGTMSIGRLDANSEGLLLLTTDGKVSAHVTSSKIEKEYYVQVDGIIDQGAVDGMKAGLTISIQGKKYTTKKCEARLLEELPAFATGGYKIRDERHGPTSWVSISIREGKFRQVRKMTAAVGFPTLKLIRVRIGDIHLDDMKAGDVIELPGFNL